jgi:hypothetical protein
MATKSKTRPTETPEARFVRVATLKVNGIIRNMKTISRLKASNPVQRKAIDDAITNALRDTMASLNGQKPDAAGFKL